MKEVSTLTPADFVTHQAWLFTGSDTPSETMVRPAKIPVRSFSGVIIGCQARLSSGKTLPAYLGNLSPENPNLMKHFLTLSVFNEAGQIFHLARYHDYDSDERGPGALADFLKMKKEDVFPIAWDVSGVTKPPHSSLRGEVSEFPAQRLTRAEIIALAVL